MNKDERRISQPIDKVEDKSKVKTSASTQNSDDVVNKEHK